MVFPTNTCQSSHSLKFLGCCFLLAACSGPGVVSTPSPIERIQSEAPKENLAFHLSDLPLRAVAIDSILVDGVLDEWRIPLSTSSLNLAIGTNGFFLGAVLEESFRDGIWFEIETEPAKLPHPYEHEINGYTIAVTQEMCEKVVLCCPFGDVEWTEELRGASEAQTCRNKLNQHAGLEEQLGKRYRRVFQVTEGGIQQLDESDNLRPTPGVQLVWKKGQGGIRVEAMLPLSVFPRVSVASLSEVSAWAGSIHQDKEDLRKNILPLKLPTSVRFDSHADLLEALMQTQHIPNELESYEGFVHKTFGVSFQPGDPAFFEILQHRSSMELFPVQLEVYQPTSTIAGFELGEMKRPIRFLKVSKEGTSHGLFRWDNAEQEVFLLDGEVVVAWYNPPRYEWKSVRNLPPSFGAFSVTQTPAKDLGPSSDDFSEAWWDCYPYEEPKGEFRRSPSGDMWEWQGSCRRWDEQVTKASSKTMRFVIRWRWNAKTKRFVREVKSP